MRRALLLLLVTACAGNDTDPITPLSVLSISPPDGAADVALDTAITLELSATPPADFDVMLAASTGEAIPHAVAIAGTTVTITPTDPLWLATDYTLSVDTFASKLATRDGAWRNLQLAQMTMAAAGPLGSGAAPSLATLRDGTVLAGWEGGANVYDQKFASGSWQPTPGVLTVVGDPGSVDVAASSTTHAVMGYGRYITRENMEARTYDGTKWSDPVIVAPYTVGTTRYDQYLGGVATTDQTHALVFHRGSFQTDQFDLYAALHNGTTWGQPFLVEQQAGEVSGGDIVDDGHGGYVIAWIVRSVDRLNTAVWMTTLSSSGTVGTPQMLDDGPGSTYSLSLARGGDTIWIAWGHEEGSIGLRVVARPYSSSGIGSPHSISLDGFSFGGEWIRIAASARGALLSYTQYGGVFAATFVNNWSTVAELDKITTNPQDNVGRPAITIDDRGNATAVWTRVPQTGRRTTMVSRARNGTWSQPVQLDKGTDSTYAWCAGVDTAGRVTTAWTQSTGTGYTVWGAYLD